MEQVYALYDFDQQRILEYDWMSEECWRIENDRLRNNTTLWLTLEEVRDVS